MFPTTGDSMLPIPEGSDILAKYVQDWTSIKAGTPCIVILNGTQDFVFKLVTVNSDNTLMLESLNKKYLPYSVPTNDILEIWAYHKYQSNKLPDSITELQEIKSMILDLSNKLVK
ncbi:helix-turn-helix transcriptional regulator [Pedobacter sp. MC2016-24]|uniref:S24 family peptidase n=1 Tax=Pedobacter sp. MC2016-24 TaxID=2780090 RepID=UPI00351C4005